LHRRTVRAQTRGDEAARLNRITLAERDNFFRNGTWSRACA
jgi:hypothetical protein